MPPRGRTLVLQLAENSVSRGQRSVIDNGEEEGFQEEEETKGQRIGLQLQWFAYAESSQVSPAESATLLWDWGLLSANKCALPYVTFQKNTVAKRPRV